MVILVTKLKRLKIALRTWNKQVFGRVDQYIASLENRIEALESSLQSDFSEEVEDDLIASWLELLVWIEREEKRLAQQAKQEWIQKGEANSSFFKTVSRRNQKEVKEMKLEDDSIISSLEQIHAGAISYLSKILEAGYGCERPILEALVSQAISLDDNALLVCIPSIQEIFQALSSILKDSSPGPNGLGSGIYRSCWHIVGTDVVDVMVAFFQGMNLSRFFNATFLVLIHKVENLMSFDKFRPISLCYVFYKIFTKIMVNRISPLLTKIISPEQGAFLPGRSIFENISMT